MFNSEFADKLAKLTLKKGVNLEKGQCLLIATPPKAYEYASAIAMEAYRMGAKYVKIDVVDPNVNAVRANVQKNDDITFVPHFMDAFSYEAGVEGWARIRIDSPDDTLTQMKYEDMDNASRMQRAMKERQNIIGQYYMKNLLPWNVCCVPGPIMAKAVLGKCGTEEELLEVMNKVYRFDQEDFLSAWDRFDEDSIRRCKAINSCNIKELHLKSSVTDLHVGLRPEARFGGGSARTPNGRSFFPNLPTEEIFSTPDMYNVNGYVKTTRPVPVLNEMTEGVTFYIHDGYIERAEAEKGQDIIDTYLDTDEGTRRLGEIALVDEKSPIAETGLVFGSILIDENASCHMAIGAGYSNCLEGGAECRNDEELHELGINTSSMHVDFMIGSKDMTITALTYEGKKVTIMQNGSFVI